MNIYYCNRLNYVCYLYAFIVINQFSTSEINEYSKIEMSCLKIWYTNTFDRTNAIINSISVILHI